MHYADTDFGHQSICLKGRPAATAGPSAKCVLRNHLVARVSAAHRQNGPTTAGMSVGLNCEELFWQHPIESLNFAAALFAKGALGKLLPARRFGVSGTGKALDMKKAVLALATAATLGVTALVTPSPAQAWRGGWGPGLAGGLIVGAVIGGIASSAYAYGPGYGYYGGPGYGYYGGPGYGYYGGYAPVYGGYAPAHYNGGYAPAYYGPGYYPGW